jgi:hypothetical protein
MNLVEFRLLVDQFRAYLSYAATLVHCFWEQSAAVIRMLEHLDGDATSPVQHLADARINLSVEPALSRAAVDAFQTRLRAAGIATFDTADGQRTRADAPVLISLTGRWTDRIRIYPRERPPQQGVNDPEASASGKPRTTRDRRDNPRPVT